MEGAQIKYVNFGIACRIGNRIYLNRRLKKDKWKKLHDIIIRHELSHSEGYKKKDFINDLNNYDLEPVKKDYVKFVTSNPSSWVEHLPFWFYDGNIVFSPGMGIIWLLTIGIILIGLLS